MRKVIKYISVIGIVFSLAYIGYFRFSEPDVTDIRFFISHWKLYISMIVFSIIVAWLNRE